MLTDEELLRYSRQILLQQVDIEGQLKLKNSRVLIIGLGGWVRRLRSTWRQPGLASCIWQTSTAST